MNPIRVGMVSLLSVATVCAGAHSAMGAGIVGVGTLGGTMSEAWGVSADGTVVTGSSVIGSDTRAYRWTSGGGMTNLGVLPSMTYSRGIAISADGTTITGVTGDSSVTASFRHVGGVMTDIGVLPGASNMYATGVNGNGNVIVGNADSFSTQQAYRWVNGSGVSDLGFMAGGSYARAAAVTANGQTIVGHGDATGTGFSARAFSWTSGGGFVNLGALPAASPESYATAVSDDGASIVGYSRHSSGAIHAVRYAGGSVIDLHTLAGYTNSFARDASLGGSTIVGGASGGSPSQAAWLWTNAQGMVNLNTYLPSIGIDLTGWYLNVATGVSADGLTIVGNGTHNGLAEGWVVTIPVPSSAAGLAGAMFIVGRRRRR